MGAQDAEGGGLKESGRRLLDSLLAILQSRLRIFSLELQEEKIRLLDLLLWLGVALGFGLVALVTLTVALALFFWDKLGPWGLVVLALVYGGAAVSAFYQVRRRLQERPPPFGDTLAEFDRDREWLGKKN